MMNPTPEEAAAMLGDAPWPGPASDKPDAKDAMHWLRYLVDFIRNDQCTTLVDRGEPIHADAPCNCCHDYLSMAEHALRRAERDSASASPATCIMCFSEPHDVAVFCMKHAAEMVTSNASTEADLGRAQTLYSMAFPGARRVPDAFLAEVTRILAHVRAERATGSAPHAKGDLLRMWTAATEEASRKVAESLANDGWPYRRISMREAMAYGDGFDAAIAAGCRATPCARLDPHDHDGTPCVTKGDDDHGSEDSEEDGEADHGGGSAEAARAGGAPRPSVGEVHRRGLAHRDGGAVAPPLPGGEEAGGNQRVSPNACPAPGCPGVSVKDGEPCSEVLAARVPKLAPCGHFADIPCGCASPSSSPALDTSTWAVDYGALDPGIRNLVRWLVSNGFATTDSGDGISKRPATIDNPDGDACAESEPNVYMLVDLDKLVSEADRLLALLGNVSDLLPQIQASYDPLDKTGIIALHGIDDKSGQFTSPARKEKKT